LLRAILSSIESVVVGPRPNHDFHNLGTLGNNSEKKHLVDFHGSPLALRAWHQNLDTPTVLMSLLLREKQIPIHLLRTKCLRKIAMSSLERLFGKRCVCYYVREVRRSEPLDVPGAEVPKDIVKAGRRFAANDVAKGRLELVLQS
jgi:hypothetical protein